MTINPEGATPGQAYEVTYCSERRVAILTHDDRLPWVVSVTPCCDHDEAWEWVESDEVSELVRLVPAREVSREDLPSVADLADFVAGDDVKLIGRVLDAVADHLNERGGAFKFSTEKLNEGTDVQLKSCCEDAAQSRAEVERLTRERDKARDKTAALARNIKWWVHQHRRAQDHRRAVEAERDELKAKLDAVNEDLSEAVTNDEILRAYQHGYAAAEKRPTLEREQVEKAIARAYGSPIATKPLLNATDAIMALVPSVPSWLGDVPDKPEAVKGPDGNWKVDGRLYSTLCSSTEFRRAGYRRIALADAIEAEEAATNDDDQRDERLAKLDAAEQRPTLERDAVMADTSWLGDVPDPDKIEVTREQHGMNHTGPVYRAGSTGLSQRSSADTATEAALSHIRKAAECKAIARFIEAEEDATNYDVDEQAKALHTATRHGMAWEYLGENVRNGFRAAIRDGWGKDGAA